ncbi:hypothetical protein PF001_g16045 [Phytophthora fragariae]|uniref:Ubiquitin-like protease family profile domain-containing protein n=1 Tax=Phytophthora fragariae TaxID=53985 RepID=A0A6A4CY10_9STRA|nr:hypothetical protein PF003_g31013 [Phytophthora fragariae]KAE9298203.1 hypothetical protein PF001_g16045 [Phytophthora fragariae]
MKNPVLIQDAFYILPAKLLDACMAVLPVANTEASAISVDEASQDAAPTAMVETIHIKDVGAFSRTQIETFKRCQNLKTAVQLGIDMHKWLSEEGLPSFPAQYHDLAREVARDVLESYPYKEMKGLSRMPDYKYTMLYRLTPPTWMTDAAIRACCERLVAGTGTCRFAGELTGRTMTKKTRSKDAVQVDVALRNRIMGYAKESAVESIFVPVNFMNAHWCCLVIKVQAKRIYFYDPLNQAPYKNACTALATHLKVSGLQEYDVVGQNNPIQFDAYSCGVYVCWMFIRHAIQGLRVDMTAASLPRRRFELLFYLMNNRLLTVETAIATASPATGDELKHPPPSEDQEDEQVPATQVAQ